MKINLMMAVLNTFFMSISSLGAVQYTITDLGSNIACSINDSGQITGSLNGYNVSGTSHAYLYSNGVLTDLGMYWGDRSSSGFAINNLGQVTGTFTGEDEKLHVFLYSQGSFTDLGSIGYSTGINDSGEICGTINENAFWYIDGKLDGYGGTQVSEARGINNSGQVVGSRFFDNAYHAFVYSNGAFTDLGALGDYWNESEGYAINNNGQVAGQSGRHAFLFSYGVMTALDGEDPMVESWAYSINDRTEVIGRFCSSRFNGYRAFLYSDGIFADLNTLINPASGWNLTDAWDINNMGQIIASGTDSQGQRHGLLLTPTPEPTSIALLGLGILALRKRQFSGAGRHVRP